MNRRLVFGLLVTALLTTGTVLADEISLGKSDTIRDFVTAQMGKRVSITLKSGKEISGTVAAVTDQLTHISALTGMEFYDAVIVTDQIESVTVRTK